MRFGLPNVLDCVRYWITPMSFSRTARGFFSSTIGISSSHFGIAEDVENSRRVRMHGLFLAWFETIFSYSHLIIFKQDFVVLRLALLDLGPLSLAMKWQRLLLPLKRRL